MGAVVAVEEEVEVIVAPSGGTDGTGDLQQHHPLLTKTSSLLLVVGSEAD
jgi:hypothetical protein